MEFIQGVKQFPLKGFHSFNFLKKGTGTSSRAFEKGKNYQNQIPFFKALCFSFILLVPFFGKRYQELVFFFVSSWAR
jgi:hypothetical protein